MCLHQHGMVQSNYCSSLVEFGTVRFESYDHFIPKEVLYGAISELKNSHPDGLLTVAGDFKHANLKSVV